MCLAGISGIWSASEVLGLSQGREPPARSRSADEEAMIRLGQLFRMAVEPDRQARAALLLVLAITLSFTLVSAARMLRPGGLPREGIRRLLSGGALVSAALRTVDGAQDAAINLRFARAAQRATGLDFGAADAFKAWMAHLPQFAVGQAVVRMLFVAGTLAVLGQYFRSSRVKDWAAIQDRS
jgi:hypothetical protein